MKKIIGKAFQVNLVTSAIKRCLDPTGFTISITKVNESATPIYINNFSWDTFSESVDGITTDYNDINRPTIIADANVGDSSVTVSDVDTQITLNDCIKIKTYVYQVVSINANVITLNKALKEAVLAVDAETISREGNNGEYNFTLNIDDYGFFKLVVKNRDENVWSEVADIVEIVEYIPSNDSASVLA